MFVSGYSRLHSEVVGEASQPGRTNSHFYSNVFRCVECILPGLVVKDHLCRLTFNPFLADRSKDH